MRSRVNQASLMRINNDTMKTNNSKSSLKPYLRPMTNELPLDGSLHLCNVSAGMGGGGGGLHVTPVPGNPGGAL